MSVSTLSNAPIEVSLPNGKKYDIKKLSVLEIFAGIESAVKSDWLSNINLLACALTDKDARKEFLASAVRDMPAGERLQQMVQNELASNAGGLKLLRVVLSKSNAITDDEFSALVCDEANRDVIEQMLDYAVGSDSVKVEKKVKAKTEAPKTSPKQTTGAT